MYQVLTLNKIAPAGLNELPAGYQYGNDVQNPDVILVRSAAMHDMEFGNNLLAIARAGAGVNNIPLDRCSEQGIAVFNTPGANANAVKELVIAGMLLASRKITAGIQWSQGLQGKGSEIGKLVEKGKSSFVGPEIKGKTLGIIGLGAIGALVANAAIDGLGMKVIGYDPFLSVKGALRLAPGVTVVDDLDALFQASDYITIHVPSTPDTKEMVRKENIAKMKDGVRILNFARADLVCVPDVVEAAKAGKIACYICDFPCEEILGIDNIIPLPHLGASTPESEDNCASMAVSEVVDYVENGNITNSVNLPNLSMARNGKVRICVIRKQDNACTEAVSGALQQAGVAVNALQCQMRKGYAYTVADADACNDAAVAALNALDGVVRVRVLD